MRKNGGALPAAEMPAKIRETHSKDRILSAVAGSPLAWRNTDWPIEIAYRRNRLGEASEARWMAISEYSSIVEVALGRSGRDSTDFSSSGNGIRFPITEAMADAIRKLITIDAHLPKKDRLIVRKLCEGYNLPNAVAFACGDAFQDTVTARIWDALDALSEAMHKAQKANYRQFQAKP